MFVHSVKVPRLYKVAGKIAQQVSESGASLKQLVYEQIHFNIKALYALVVEILKHSNKLDYLIRTTQILTKENRLDPWLTRVLITELLWGKQHLATACKPVQTILKYKDEFIKSLENYTDDCDPADEKKVSKPRYVRVNTLKTTVTKVIEIFRDEGWTLLKCDNSNYEAFLAIAASLSDDQFIIDIHISDLLVFPPNTQFHQHPLYRNSAIILQDKASCLPPFLLAPEAGSRVLDMCAAPGMKTSQLAAMVEEQGTIFAIERDQRRYEILCKITEGMGTTNIKCINKDVMTMTNKDIPDIDYILVDPSCSGSGMVDRIKFKIENKSRLQSLAGFQITILRHALSNFPNVKRVIYSTCSVYPEENEEVIQQVLSSVPNFKIVPLKERLNSKWFNFGSKDFGEIGTFSLCTKPEEDLTNGFFITLFERCRDGETNLHFIKRVKRSFECHTEESSNEVNYSKKKRINSEYEFMDNENNSNHTNKKSTIDSVEPNDNNKNVKIGNQNKKEGKNSDRSKSKESKMVDGKSKLNKEQISTGLSEIYLNVNTKKINKKKEEYQADVIEIVEDLVKQDLNKVIKIKYKKKNKLKERLSNVMNFDNIKLNKKKIVENPISSESITNIVNSTTNEANENNIKKIIKTESNSDEGIDITTVKIHIDKETIKKKNKKSKSEGKRCKTDLKKS